MQLVNSLPGYTTMASHLLPTKTILPPNYVGIWSGSGANFSCKRNVTSQLRGNCSAFGRERSLLVKLLLTGAIVLALCATVLAWNFTDVALLIAIGFGGFVRTMEALTLQLFQITAHNSCVLLTLPATKTGKRTGETQSVVVDDPLLVSVINRLLCILCPKNFLLQRSPHSFRTIFASLLRALQLDQFRFTPYSLRKGGATTHCMLFRNMDATIEKGRWSSVKTARINLKESIAVYNSLSIPAQQLACFHQLSTPRWICSSAKHFQNSVNFDWHEHFVEFSKSRAACVCSVFEPHHH